MRSPVFTLSAVLENRLSFWLTRCSSASAACAARTSRPMTTMAPVTLMRASPLRLLPRQRRDGRQWVGARERFQECHQIGLLLHGEVQHLHVLRLARSIGAALLIEIHHLRERGEGAVVHVGRALIDVP